MLPERLREDVQALRERIAADVMDVLKDPAVVKRLADTSLAQAAAPLTSRFEYRLYRTVTAAKARASARGSAGGRGDGRGGVGGRRQCRRGGGGRTGSGLPS